MRQGGRLRQYRRGYVDFHGSIGGYGPALGAELLWARYIEADGVVLRRSAQAARFDLGDEIRPIDRFLRSWRLVVGFGCCSRR